MSNKHYKVLITRPESQGRALAKTLSQEGFDAVCAPLFNYQPLTSKQSYYNVLETNPDIIIFVSVAAVEYAHQTVPLSHWPSCTVLAVGQATKNKLISLGISTVISPEIQTSEGLLELSELSHPHNRNIIIVRGNGGRELIAESLRGRGAQVHYIESYQRRWIEQPEDICHQWQQLNVNCIVITSNEILQSVVQLTKNKEYFWQHSCLWIVASERIAKNASALGLQNVFCAYGASDEAILGALHNMEQAHDREKNINGQ
ncbi:uroporphyrinogen-III synthase [Thalassotalea atypica]|uniref:uroporphyrinogen-III synthase n=1 Tax=Thalassotalea atypica TaxID=2054316 RepID=UPI0025736225|nr:uroporphyrinogen-III synthase [Thalassotalea atypica]